MSLRLTNLISNASHLLSAYAYCSGRYRDGPAVNCGAVKKLNMAASFYTSALQGHSEAYANLYLDWLAYNDKKSRLVRSNNIYSLPVIL